MDKKSILRSVILFGLTIVLSQVAFGQRKKKTTAPEPTKANVSQEVEYLFIEAEKLYLLKNYSQSTELFNKCLALDPQNDVIYYKLAEINNSTEQYNVAAKQIEIALTLNNANKYYYLLAVDIYTNLGDLKHVASSYESLINTIPKSETYLFNLAAVYIYLQDYNTALKTYDKAEQIFGLSENISFQRQKLYLQLNRLEDAINESKRLIAKYPDNPQYVLMLVEILSSNNRLEEATSQLQNLLSKSPDFSPARLSLADIYWKTSNLEGFKSELNIAFEDKNLNINAKINLLMRYLAFVPNETLEVLIPQLAEILMVVHPDDYNAFLMAGDVYSTLLEKDLVQENKEKAMQKAARAYAKYVSLDPSNFSVWQNLLNLELQLDLKDSLAKHAEQALELYPNQAWVYLVNGIVKQNQQNMDQAVVMLEMGKKRASGNKQLLILLNSYLGDIYNELKDYEKSDNAYESVLELDPLNFTVLNNYSYYLSLRAEKLEQAKKMSTTLIRNNPDNQTYLDTYAWVHYILGDYNEAKRVFEKIIDLGVDEGVYYDHYGDTLYKLGNEDAAVVQWTKARELDKTLENIDQKIKQRKIVQ